MADEMLLERITVDPKVLVGKPVIKGTRLSVECILNQLPHGATTEDLVEEYAGLTEEDIRACLLFASRSLDGTDFMPLIAEFPPADSGARGARFRDHPGQHSKIKPVTIPG